MNTSQEGNIAEEGAQRGSILSLNLHQGSVVDFCGCTWDVPSTVKSCLAFKHGHCSDITWLLDRRIHFRSLLIWDCPEDTHDCHFSLGTGETSITKSDRMARGRDDHLCDMGPGCVQESSFLTSESPEIHGHCRNKKPHRSLEIPFIAPSYLWYLQLSANLELYVSFSGKKNNHPVLNGCRENTHLSFPLLLGLPLISCQYLMSGS